VADYSGKSGFFHKESQYVTHHHSVQNQAHGNSASGNYSTNSGHIRQIAGQRMAP
jgi:hypothetical protein